MWRYGTVACATRGTQVGAKSHVAYKHVDGSCTRGGGTHPLCDEGGRGGPPPLTQPPGSDRRNPARKLAGERRVGPALSSASSRCALRYAGGVKSTLATCARASGSQARLREEVERGAKLTRRGTSSAPLRLRGGRRIRWQSLPARPPVGATRRPEGSWCTCPRAMPKTALWADELAMRTASAL